MQANPKRQTAARILLLFSVLFTGTILITAQWKGEAGAREWHNFPSALGDKDYISAETISVAATIGGKLVSLQVEPKVETIQDRFQYQVGQTLPVGPKIYAFWESTQSPGQAAIPAPSTEFYVKTNRNSYRKALVVDAPASK